MAFRSDVSIDWTVSPRIITVAAPAETITVQDLSTTLRVLESDHITSMTRQYILDNEGKFDLGTKLTGISLRFIDAKLAFEARAGPTWAECSVTGGNISAVDDVGAILYPIEFQPYVAVAYESDTSAALLKSDEIDLALDTILTDVAFIRAVQGGRWKIDETALQIIFYDESNSVEVARFNMIDIDGNPTAVPEDAYERVRV